MDVLEKACEMAAQGKDIIHLEVGEPDFDTPACVKTAACKALDEGFTHYTHSLGLLDLREAICVYYRETYNVHIDPEQILVTSGSSPAIFMLFSALLESGDQVIISDPHYACYPNFIQFAQGEVVTVPCTKKTVFSSDHRKSKKRYLTEPRRFSSILPQIPPAIYYRLDACKPLPHFHPISSQTKFTMVLYTKERNTPFWSLPTKHSCSMDFQSYLP